MNKQTVTLWMTGFLFVGAFFAGQLEAKTVALWKLDYEAGDSMLNTRCLLDPANDLSPSGTLWKGAAVDAWQGLPPNPDASTNLLASPKNQNAVGLSPSSSYLTSTTVGSRVNITNSFTVEGWWNLSANPVNTGWFYLVGAHTGGAGRWILSLRNGGTNWVLFVDSLIIDKSFPVKNDPAATNVWRHIALTYDRNAGSVQQGVWNLFVDSQSYGAITNTSRPATLSTADSVFMLGGRSGNSGMEKLDYWRVTDAALATNAFLSAGVATIEPETLPRTSFYWRLDGSADGVMDTRDFVGGARLSGSLDITNHTTTIQAATVQTFDGQPPNSADALPGGNAGSAYAQAAGACMRVPDLGAQLEITNSFTVEGWLCPHRQDYDADVQYIANTRINTKGWAFGLKKQTDSTRKFVIFAEDDAGVLAGDVPISGDLSAWSDSWRHVALVYDATAGALAQGVWSCYLDGARQGSVTNSRARSGDSASAYFHLAGRVSNGSTFCGYLDCWRACKAALVPNQFMNATNGAAAAAGVLALWPLNSTDGVYLDATDVVGTYGFNTPVASQYKVTASTGQATTNVPNPDATAAFKGDPAANAGSIIFNTPAVSATRAYLATTDTTVRETLCYTNSFTWEGWFCRTQNPGDWQILFASASAPSFTTGGMSINLTYRSNGYVLYAGGSSLVSDVAFGGITDDKTLNVWRHVALVYDITVGKGTWSLYVDGAFQGAIENAVIPSRTVPGGVYVGGRPWSANSFYGAIDAVRLTKGVLAPSQFLNAAATPAAPAAPRTVAFWKLDSASNTLAAASQVEPRYSFILDAYAPAGSASQFGRFVPVPDATAGFVGDPRANAGSAAFSGADYLRIQNLGYRLELDRAFTVEGWMLWSNQTAAAVQTLAGTRFGADYGWRLTLNTSGDTAAFRLFCQVPSRTPLLDAAFAFNAAGLAGAWHHLALTYTPRRSDTGAWELFVDGTSVGSAANRFYPTTLQQSHWFILGGTANGVEAFDGLLDCWRVTEGALTTEQFLFLGYTRGTLIQLF